MGPTGPGVTIISVHALRHRNRLQANVFVSLRAVRIEYGFLSAVVTMPVTRWWEVTSARFAEA